MTRTCQQACPSQIMVVTRPYSCQDRQGVKLDNPSLLLQNPLAPKVHQHTIFSLMEIKSLPDSGRE